MPLKKYAARFKNNHVGIRLTDKEYNEIKLKANLYTDGNVSQWMLYCAENYRPTAKELIEEIPRIQRKKERDAV